MINVYLEGEVSFAYFSRTPPIVGERIFIKATKKTEAIWCEVTMIEHIISLYQKGDPHQSELKTLYLVKKLNLEERTYTCEKDIVTLPARVPSKASSSKKSANKCVCRTCDGTAHELYGGECTICFNMGDM